MKEVLVQTNQTVRITGYYIYKRSATYGEVPQIPTPKQNTMVLEQGDIVPDVNGYDSIYKLVAEKKRTKFIH